MSAAEKLSEGTVPREEYGERPRTKELRIRVIMHLMGAGRFVKGETGLELAEAWELSIDTIDKDTQEASRRIKDVVNADYVRTRCSEALDAALEWSRGDPKATAAVVNAFAPLAGVSAKHVTVSGGDGTPLTFRVETSSPERPTS